MLDSGRVHPDCRDKVGDHALVSEYNVMVTPQDGTTPLMLAARSGREKVVSLLLQEGADPNIR